MIVNITLVAAGLLLATIVQGSPAPFPDGRTLVYDYYGDVKAGITKPAVYASQYAIVGKLNIRHDTSDSDLNRAYYFAFTDVKTGIHNGLGQDLQGANVSTSIPEAAKAILKPFLVVYNDLGQLKGVKLAEDDPGWSRNMKMATASMLQLDLASVQLDKAFRPQSYMVQEKTVHGDCWTSYDIHSRDPEDASAISLLTVYKFSSPRNCSNYRVHSFNHVDAESCDLSPEAPMNMAARRVFQVENQGKNLLITSLLAHGGANYFPWKGRSAAHYMWNNASFMLEKNVESSEINLPQVDFQNIPLTRNLTYIRPTTNYAGNAGKDLTHGRHEVNQDDLIHKVRRLLETTADYLEENQLNTAEYHQRGQAINEIVHMMGFMNSESFEEIFKGIPQTLTPHQKIIRDLFFDIIPQVGTMASCIFAKNLILNHETSGINEADTLKLLIQLPSHIRDPTPELFRQMQDLNDIAENYTTGKSIILCLSSILFRLFKDDPNASTNIMVTDYLNRLMYLLKTDPSYEMKVVYLMAMKNVQVGDIHKYLAPLIRGDIELSDRPAEIRLMAILAVQKAVANDYNVAHDLLWPVMADYRAPLKIRIAAYDILIRQVPTMTNILHIHWFMVYEKSKHLYNYHYTTIQGLANSVDPCQYHLRELTTKIMRLTRIVPPASFKMSASYIFDVMDDVYGHGEKLTVSLWLEERTGFPEMIHIEYTTIEERKSINNFKMYLHLGSFQDLHKIWSHLTVFQDTYGSVVCQKVRKILEQAASQNPSPRDTYLDLVIMRNDRVVSLFHTEQNNLETILENVLKVSLLDILDTFAFTNANLAYDYLNEEHFVSEMGLPIVLETKIPRVTLLFLEYSNENERKSVKATSNIKIWRHGHYSMSIYNPLMDVWHSIRHYTALDVALPLTLASVASHDIRFRIDRLPRTKYSVVGMKSHAKDLTTISPSIPLPSGSCFETVSAGPGAKKNFHRSLDLKDTGLHYSLDIFDCENGVTPIYLRRELARLFTTRQNSWGDSLLHAYLAVRQHTKNVNEISPRPGSCGYLVKMEPSTVYPTAHLFIDVRGMSQSMKDDESPYFLEPERLDAEVAVTAVASGPSPDIIRQWNMTISMSKSAGHLENLLSIDLTRTTPNEKNLKICFDAVKKFKRHIGDALEVGLFLERSTYTNVTFLMGYTDDIDCVDDQTVISIGARGLHSREQAQLLDGVNRNCARDSVDPVYGASETEVPRSVNCFEDAIKYSSLRRYKVDVIYEKVPPEMVSAVLAVEDAVRAVALPHVVHGNASSQPGTAQIELEVSMTLDKVNVSVVTPSRSYTLRNLELGVDNFPPRHVGMVVDEKKSLWMMGLDNTRFSVNFLAQYITGSSKICSIFVKITETFDGGRILYDIPQNWTLMTGISNNFAIFVKNVEGKIAMKMYISRYEIEIHPEEDRIELKINGRTINTDKFIYVNKILQVIQIIKRDDDISFHVNQLDTKVIYTVKSVTVMSIHELQGELVGLCGDMDGQYLTHFPKTYILND